MVRSIICCCFKVEVFLFLEVEELERMKTNKQNVNTRQNFKTHYINVS